MIDANTVTRGVLLTSSALSALVGTRIYQGLLPKGYQITNPAITFHIRGGSSDPDLPLLEQSIGFRCWGNTPIKATEVARALSDFLLSKAARAASPSVVRITEESLGTPQIDPDVGWDSVLSYYNFLFIK